MKKTVLYKLSAITAVVAVAASCSDFLDRKNPAYDTEGFYETEAGLKEGVTGVYASLYWEQNWDVPFCIVADHYTAYGLEQNENNSIGAGGGLNPDQSYVQSLWSGEYTTIARANSVLYGARDNIENMSDEANQYYAETRVIRAYAYYNLISAFGDVPFFTSPVTIDQYTAGRTTKGEIINYLIEDLDDAANYLPWTAAERGRVDKATAYGLISRIGLFAGSFNVDGKGADYFRTAADYAQMVIGQRHLAKNFHDLFTPEGQTKNDVRDEILWELVYSTDATKMTQTVGYGHSSRQYGSSVRFPSSLIVDTYECIDGKRIDESPLYDPTHPTRNRDPRFRETLAGHGDTIDFFNGSAMKMVLNIYDAKTRLYPRRNAWYNADNQDVMSTAPTIVNTGVGYVWRKYANYNTEMLQSATTNIILMRYAEILLNYAEAKIEADDIDQTVLDAINKVRARAYGCDYTETDKL